jgi:hypothetical protein
MLFRNPFTNRNRKVRLYLQGGSVLTPAGKVEQDGLTIEGILAGETRRHYIIWAPKVVTEENRGRGSSVDISGHVEIPRERVIWYQVLG